MFEIAAFQHAIDQQHSPDGKRLHMKDALALQWAGQRQVWQRANASLPAQPVPGDALWLSVADGVSASPHAALASRSFLQTLHGQAWPRLPAPAALPALVREARAQWQSRHLRPHTQGASTTLASVLLAQGKVCAVNCGDSRIWRLRPLPAGGMAWQPISRDQTVWQHMLDEGEVTPEQRDTYASIYQGLLHCLTLGEWLDDSDDGLDDGGEADGPAADEWLHIWHGELHAGDALLLATDGLHETLGDAFLQCLWDSQADLTANVQALREAYLAAGAPDDCSVVAVAY